MSKNTLLFLTATCTLLGGIGCSSVMTHTGPNQGYYPGTRASLEVLEDDDTSWSMVPFAAIDLPFSAVLDTVLLPYDYLNRNSDKSLDSPRERMLKGSSKTDSHKTSSTHSPAPSK
ncbi:YceK/YidQ family lipoprotein [Acerihabitans sp. KWT182]|uniref:YceK/YidQ family lipoprotein n=1 Tax=Acerihabitans sp. KWT182 TaxID=3157919 RepID=A0AAU7Q9X3_9GAMM